VSYPILDSQGHALAALTVPYAERMDQSRSKPIAQVEEALGAAAKALTAKVGGRLGAASLRRQTASKKAAAQTA
jgi:DNA-binding IclR family transcriptional regulator